jgi:hypothetical protein
MELGLDSHSLALTYSYGVYTIYGITEPSIEFPGIGVPLPLISYHEEEDEGVQGECDDVGNCK